MAAQLTKSLQTAPRGNSAGTDQSARQHLLTINVEDYFQAGVFQKYINADNWYRFESRLKKNVEHILQLLEQHESKATFFLLGWTAEREPSLVKTIADAGHEVASRGFLHQRLTDLPAEQVRDDLRKAKDVLEDCVGTSVDGFRLSDGWIKKDSLWLLDEIAAAGYRYDSSIMPRRRDFKNQSEWRSIQQLETRHGKLTEVPLTTVQVAGSWLPVAGGNYLRQMPNAVMQRVVEKTLQRQSDPFVMYFQVWELDDEQPELSVVDRMTRLRHYRKLGKYRRILPEYLKRYSFTSVRNHALRDDSPLKHLKAVSNVRTTKTKSTPSIDPQNVSQRSSSVVSAVKTPATIVIPCFNEEKSLAYLANTLTSVSASLSHAYKPHWLFVDDCSTDGTYDALQALFADDASVSIVRHEVNKGVSAAILTGLRHAETNVVCSMDCDCSYDPHELSKMLPLLTEDTAMVTASPYHRDGHVRNVPGWRLLLSRGLSVIYQRLLKQPLATWTACFRVYRRDQILDLPLEENGFLGTAELAAQLIRHDRRIVEHPATLEVRLFGFSKMKTLRAICSHLKLLMRIAFSRPQN